MTRESYNILYTMFLSQKLTKKIRKMTEEQYNILYTIIYSQKIDKKNDSKKKID